MSPVLAGQYRRSPQGVTYYVRRVTVSVAGDGPAIAELHAPGDVRTLRDDIVERWPVVPTPPPSILGNGF